ncbi:MAG TPA: apolipoprotein N-acyltransferase [Gemmatimonadales bacterium]|nr:apolipoprotein N-acyltransferase [Gemmatimonadales bacterium]
MSGRRAALLCAAGALLLTGSYPPFDLPALSFMAITPAVVLLRSAVDQGDPGRAFRWGLAYGAATQGLLLYWIAIALWHFTPLSALGYFVTVVVLTVYTGGLFWLVARAATRGRVPLWVAFPVAWTALEWWIGHQGEIAFPWLGLGTSLADAPVLVQWADLAGARGATLWLAWINVMLVETALDWGRGRGDEGRGRTLRRLIPVGVTLVLALGYGVWRMRTLPVRDVGVVGMIQPNEGFDEKWDRPPDSVMARLLDMSRRVSALARPDLIVWPEAAMPGYLEQHPQWDAGIAELARERHAPILAGGLSVTFHADQTYDSYNAAFFYDSTGSRRPYPIYGKRYLVPVTERVPFFPVSWFRRIPGLKRWSGGFARGRERPVYEAALGGFGVVICYESAFEDLPRRYRRASADFLVNITNDAWFGRTSAPAQHASHLVLRAIETRMGVARAANSGISQFVDPLGHTYASTGLGTEALVADRLRTSDVTTVYVRLGDWVGTLAVLGTLGLAWLALVPRRP